MISHRRRFAHRLAEAGLPDLAKPVSAGRPLALAAALYTSTVPTMPLAAQPTNSPAPAPSSAEAAQSNNPSDIVVTAPPSERSSIDRTTYTVRDNAESRATNVLDILSLIPSIDVTPSGQIRLFGRSGVKILIDGRESANPLEVLRNTQGSQIVRIEVVSNPSAQFSAQGTAGVINVITRRSQRAGLGGSVTAGAGIFGSYDVKVSPTWGSDRLSVSGSLRASRNSSLFDIRRERYVVATASQLLPVESETGRSRSHMTTLAGNLLATYRLSDLATIAASVNASRSESVNSTQSLFRSGGVGGDVLEQTSRSPAHFHNLDYSLEYRRQGQRKGESLTVAAQRSRSSIVATSIFSAEAAAGASRTFTSAERAGTALSSIKLDYVRPAGVQRTLTFGAAIQRVSSPTSTIQRGDIGLSGDLVVASSRFSPAWTESAAYVTYQMPLLGGTFLPGLRVERRGYDLASAGRRTLSGTHLFPTLHMERPLGRATQIDLSYSRRIAWPNIGALNPDLRFSDRTTASIGNSSLRPEITDSYEAKLHTKRGKHSLDLTAFARRTVDLFSNLTELSANGVLVTRNLNLGTLTSHGVDLAVRGPLGSHFQYSANADVSGDSLSKDAIDTSLNAMHVQYSVVGKIEYRDGVQEQRGADHATFLVRYYGPIQRGLFIASASTSISASWSHIFTDRLSALFNLDGISVPKGRTTTFYAPSTLSVETYRSLRIRATASLTYSLKAPQ